MAHVNPDGYYSLPAAADYTAITKPRLVTINTSGQFATTTAGARADGVGENFPIAAAAMLRAGMIRGGIYKAEVGAGGVTLGARVSSDANGKLVISATSTHVYVGKALRAGAAGEVVEFLYDGLGTEVA